MMKVSNTGEKPKMNKMLYVAAAAALVATQANAQVMVEQVENTTTVTHEVPANPYSDVPTTTTTTYTTVETTAVGSAPTVDPGHMATVKLEDGTTTQFPDTADKSWQEYAREKGYDRFTFDPTSGLFVVGKGEAKFADRWDENGNRVPTPVAKPAVKKAAKKVVVKEEAATEEALPAETAPAETAPVKEPAIDEKPATPTAEVQPATPADETPPAGAEAHGSGH